MKRALFSQIKNDWKENIWIILELLVVALVIWYLSLSMIRAYRNLTLPLGADIDHVYGARINLLDENGGNILFFYPSQLEPELRERLTTDLQAMLDRVRNLPMVEYAALGNNALPYNYNFSGNLVKYKHGNDTLQFSVNTRIMTPEGVKVLRLKGKRDEDLDRLQSVLEKGQLLFGAPMHIDLPGDRQGYDMEDLLDTPLEGTYSGTRIGGIIEAIRRTHYEPNFDTGTVVGAASEHTPQILLLDNLMVRVKPGHEKEFEMAMEQEPALLSPTDIAISNLRPISADRELTTWNNDVEVRTYMAGILFLLAIIFLGLLGTFWYRVYLRTPEIAVRKTFGATDADIFRRLISEALILLSISLTAAVILGVCLRGYLDSDLFQYYAQFDTWHTDMVLGAVITAAIMTLIIIIGVGIPARHAMNIEPALALKVE